MTAPVTYTTRQAADLLGLTPGRIRQLAASMGVGQTRQEQRGPVLVFGAADIESLRERNTTVGRPKRNE